MNKERLFTLVMVILAAAASRLLPHPDNVAPITAIALFAGAKFERKSLAFAVPLLALLASDAVIGFYERQWVVYGAFSLIVCMGLWLRARPGAAHVLAASLLASVLFFLLTNCSVCSAHSLYPFTWEGTLLSYEMGLPFFRNTLLGDLFYTLVLFGGFALAERRFAFLRVRPLAAA